MRKKRLVYMLSVVSFVAILLGCSVGMAQIHSPDLINSLGNNSKIIASDELLADFRDGKEQTSVIVIVRSPEETAGHPTVAGRPANLQTETNKQLVRSAVSASINVVVDQLDTSMITVTRRFSYLAGFAATVTPEGVEQIISLPDVVSVEKNRILEAHLAQGVPLMNATSARSSYSGGGISIAICDTGVDTSHPRLGNGGSPIFNSKVIGGRDTGNNDDDPRPSSGSAHGTACAGIAAGDTGTVGDYIGGVAPDAKLYAIKIAGPDPSTSATTAAMIAGWEWPITHQNDDPTHPILIISTSFGGGRFTSVSSCESASPAMTTAALNAVAAGITIFASSGNDGYCDSMGWPACISHVNSVGAVYDADIGRNPDPGYVGCIKNGSCAGYTVGCPCLEKCYVDATTAGDQVTTYSNSASFLDIFAPSNDAYTADIVGNGGYTTGDYTTSFGGTSAACPYAAGAAAVLQHAAKTKSGSYLTPAQVKQYLVNNGDNVTDDKVAVTKPRVNLGNAVNALDEGGKNSWPMYLAAITAGKSSPQQPQWGAGSDVCCTTSSSTFSLTSSGVTKKSYNPNCSTASTWEGWVTTSPGTKSFSWSWSSPNCGTASGSFNYSLSEGKTYYFQIEWEDPYLVIRVYVKTATSGTASAEKEAVLTSAKSANDIKDSMQLVDTIPLNIPKGVFTGSSCKVAN